MSAEALGPRGWTLRKWLGAVMLVLAVHLGLIFWMADRKAVVPEPRVNAPAAYLTPDQSLNLPGFSDPTLFVLANPHGFSGPAWLKVPFMEYHAKEWTEPEPPTTVTPDIGRTLNEFEQSNLARPFEVAVRPEPRLDVMPYTSLQSDVATNSTFSVEGELARRRLLSSFKLESMPSAEILTNSDVLVAVNPEGTVFSAVLLTKCGPANDPGAKAADARAMELAKSARFEPLRWNGMAAPASSPTALTWGRLKFRWRSTGLPETNGTAQNP